MMLWNKILGISMYMSKIHEELMQNNPQGLPHLESVWLHENNVNKKNSNEMKIQ